MSAGTQKHTKGPWASDNTRKYYDAWLIRHNGIAVARMMQDTTRTKEEHEANARLIAAAPELLEALEDAHAVLLDVPGHEAKVVLAKVYAAIAKAEGQV